MTHPVWDHYHKAATKGFRGDKGRWAMRCKACIQNAVTIERSRQLNVEAATGQIAQTEEDIQKEVVVSHNPQPIVSKNKELLEHLTRCSNVTSTTKTWAEASLRDLQRESRESAAKRALARNKENVPTHPPNPTPGSSLHRTDSQVTLVDEDTILRPSQRRRTDSYEPQTEMSTHFQHVVPEPWSHDRAARFAADLCRLMVVCNIAWCNVEHPYWRYFFQEWLPNAPVPGRKELSGRILQEQVQLCVTDMRNKTGGKFATGQCDGWKDVARKSIIASMWNVEYTPYLVNTDDISAQAKTADNLLTIVLREIQYALEVLKVIVVAWCTDASGESAKMRRLLVRLKPWIVVVDCWAHQINLVVGDMLKVSGEFLKCIEDALEVVKWFNNHSRALGLLRESMQRCLARILALILPVITRWTSHYLCVRRLLEVARPMREAALNPALLVVAGSGREAVDKAQSIVSTVLRPDFWQSLERAKAHLEPLAMAANVTQSDSARLDVVLMTLANLHHYFSTTPGLVRAAADRVVSSLQSRWEKLDQDIALLALIFNPLVRVSCFAEDSPFRVPGQVYELAKAAFRRFYEVEPGVDFQNQLTDYLRSAGLWTPQAMRLDEFHMQAKAEDREVNLLEVWRSCAPISSRCEGQVPPSGTARLCLLATRILSIVPNSAAVERIFSLFGIVHTKLRNRLGPEKARNEVLLKVNTAMRYGHPGNGRKRKWLEDDDDDDNSNIAAPSAAIQTAQGALGEGQEREAVAERGLRAIVREIMDELEEEEEERRTAPPAQPRPNNASARLLCNLFDFPAGASASHRGLQHYWTVALRNLEREAAYHDVMHEERAQTLQAMDNIPLPA